MASAEYQRAWRLRNRDAVNERKRARRREKRLADPDGARRERRADYLRYRDVEREQQQRWYATPEGKAKRLAVNAKSRAKTKGSSKRLLLDAKRLVGLSAGVPMRCVPRAIAEVKAMELAVKRAIRTAMP